MVSFIYMKGEGLNQEVLILEGEGLHSEAVFGYLQDGTHTYTTREPNSSTQANIGYETSVVELECNFST